MLPPPAPPTVRDRLVRLRLMLVALSVCLWGVVVIVRLVTRGKEEPTSGRIR